MSYIIRVEGDLKDVCDAKEGLQDNGSFHTGPTKQKRGLGSLPFSASTKKGLQPKGIFIVQNETVEMVSSAFSAILVLSCTETKRTPQNMFQVLYISATVYDEGETNKLSELLFNYWKLL